MPTLRPAANLGLQSVLDQHRARHWADAAWIWRQPTGHLVDPRSQVSDLASVHPVGADVYDCSTRLDHVPGDEIRLARGCDQYVGASGVARKVPRPRVTQSHRRVALQQQKSGRLTDQV